MKPMPGEAVLDVGCGTGGLAMAARRRVGPTGSVAGIDPSPEMVLRASGKARRARLDIGFKVAAAQALPFEDAAFDVVLCTLVLHQLPHDGLQQCLSEMRRVLKPGGRLLLVDMGGPQDGKRTVHSQVAEVRPGPQRHHAFDLDGVADRLGMVGLRVVSRGPVTFPLRRLERLRYVVATPEPAA